MGGEDDSEEPESIFNQVVRYEAAQAKLVATQTQVQGQPRVLPPGWRETFQTPPWRRAATPALPMWP